MIYTESNGQTFLCTGTLLNDTVDSTSIPYFLTANHCISTQSVASTLVTYWDFEKSSCNGANPTSVTQLTGGADLLRTYSETDSTLLRLRSSPPGDNRFYAGWNATTLTHPTNIISVHHPRGDLKKWSSGSTSSHSSRIIGSVSRRIIIVRWSQGTTEGGSSGSGLFDSMGRLRGSLSGGPAACGESDTDYYGRFDQFYPEVRRWLNPADAVAGVTFSRTNLSMFERGTNNYTVVLNTQPTGNVTVTITRDNTDVTLNPSALTFTTNNWNTDQTVTVTAEQDADSTDDTAILSHVVSGYGSVTTADNVTVVVTDDNQGDTRTQATSVALNTMTAGYLHNGDWDYFRLTITQSTTLTVETSGSTDTLGFLYDANGTELANNDDINLPGGNLNFRITRAVTAGTYYVAVRGYFSSFSGTYATGPYTLHVIVPPQVVVSTTSLSVDEGSSGTYTANLDTQPIGDVTVTITRDNPDVTLNPGALTFTSGDWNTAQTVTVTAGQDIDNVDDTATLSHTVSGYGEAITADRVMVAVTDNYSMPGVSLSQPDLALTEGSSGTYTANLDTQPIGDVTVTITRDNPDVTLNPGALTFTSGDWNTAQTVTVTAGQDIDNVDDTATLSHTVSGYTGVTTAASVTVTVADAARVHITPARLSLVEGATGTYTVRLGEQPTSNVTITIAGGNGDVTASPGSLIFTSSDWNTFQTVTVMAGRDVDNVDDTETLSHTVSGYGSVTTADNVTVVVTDDNHGNTRAQATSVALNTMTAGYLHNGDWDYFRLTITQSTTLTVETSGSTDTFGFLYDANGTELARDDDTGSSRNFRITRDVTAGTYYAAVRGFRSSITGAYTLRVTGPEVAVSTTQLNLDEGSSGNYTMNLGTQPIGDVTVTITRDNPDVTLNPGALTFTPGDWNTAQTVTVIAEQDSDALHDTAALSHTVSDYGVLTAANEVTVTVTDSDEIPVETADVNGDRYLDTKDALILFYVDAFQDLPVVRDNLLSRQVDTDDVTEVVTRADSWQRSSAGGDLNLDGSVNAQDALIMYYAFEFKDLLRTQSGLRRLLLHELRGALPDTDASYRQLLHSVRGLGE